MDDRTPANLGEAIEWAIGIQEHFPERLLCGSAAMVLYGVLRKDFHIGDLDFAAPFIQDDDLADVCYEGEDDLPNKSWSPNHEHYFVDSPFPHCVFVGPCTPGVVIAGIQCLDKLEAYKWVKVADATRIKKTLAWCNRR